jgi:hypothetical protein
MCPPESQYKAWEKAAALVNSINEKNEYHGIRLSAPVVGSISTLVADNGDGDVMHAVLLLNDGRMVLISQPRPENTLVIIADSVIELVSEANDARGDERRLLMDDYEFARLFGGALTEFAELDFDLIIEDFNKKLTGGTPPQS